MSDFVFVLITVVSFAALALLVGLLERHLGDASAEYDEPAAPEATPPTSPTPPTPLVTAAPATTAAPAPRGGTR